MSVPNPISCATCLAFNEPGLECRRKSPVMVPIPGANLAGQQGLRALGMYPATQKGGWCCEHQPGRIPEPEPQSATLAIAR